MSRKRVTRLASKLLERAGVDSAPVDVQSLAGSVAHVVSKEMPDDVSGMLVPLEVESEGKEWAIVVNATHPPVRQRFTIAHELGHLLLHGFSTTHADSGYRVRFRDPASAEGSVREEIEANQFAAEILMPAELLVLRLEEEDLDYAAVESNEQSSRLNRVAKDFEVSQESLSIRISTLLA